MKLIYLKSELKSDSFDVSIGTKIPIFRVSVTIEPGRSLLTVRYHELFDWIFSLVKKYPMLKSKGFDKNIFF
jgi:hypothetical protein